MIDFSYEVRKKEQALDVTYVHPASGRDKCFEETEAFTVYLGVLTEIQTLL